MTFAHMYELVASVPWLNGAFELSVDDDGQFVIHTGIDETE